MKTIKSLLLLSAVSLTILLLTSWSIQKNTSNHFLIDKNNPLDKAGSVFVVYKDGRIVSYQTLKLVRGVFSSPHLLADGKIKINPSEINIFQNEEQYAISQSLISDGRKSALALETLPGFAVRLVKGPLNLYSKKYNNGGVVINEYFIQLGNDGKIQKYNPALMKSLIKDNPETSTYFSEKLSLLEDLDLLKSTVSLYNKTVDLNETFASSNK